MTDDDHKMEGYFLDEETEQGKYYDKELSQKELTKLQKQTLDTQLQDLVVVYDFESEYRTVQNLLLVFYFFSAEWNPQSGTV